MQDASLRAMMEEMMQNPDMAHLMKSDTTQAPFEDPTLTGLLSPIRKHKQTGGDKFKEKDTIGALSAYQAAVAAAGGTNGVLAWPQAETLVFVCRSNAALCLLQLGRPVDAVVECDSALALPCANDSDLLSKVLARKLQGLVDSGRGDVFGFLDELRRRGCFDDAAHGQAKLIEQVARLRPKEIGTSNVEQAFNVLTEQWRSSSICLEHELDAATDRIANSQKALRDRVIMREMSALAAPVRRPADTRLPGRMPISDLIGFVMNCFTDSTHPELADTTSSAKVLRWALLRGGMHPSHPGSVDTRSDGGNGNLLWGLCSCFERSLPVVGEKGRKRNLRVTGGECEKGLPSG